MLKSPLIDESGKHISFWGSGEDSKKICINVVNKGIIFKSSEIHKRNDVYKMIAGSIHRLFQIGKNVLLK